MGLRSKGEHAQTHLLGPCFSLSFFLTASFQHSFVSLPHKDKEIIKHIFYFLFFRGVVVMGMKLNPYGPVTKIATNTAPRQL